MLQTTVNWLCFCNMISLDFLKECAASLASYRISVSRTKVRTLVHLPRSGSSMDYMKFFLFGTQSSNRTEEVFLEKHKISVLGEGLGPFYKLGQWKMPQLWTNTQTVDAHLFPCYRFALMVHLHSLTRVREYRTVLVSFTKGEQTKTMLTMPHFFGNNSGNQNMHKLVQILFYLSDDDYFSWEC